MRNRQSCSAWRVDMRIKDRLKLYGEQNPGRKMYYESPPALRVLLFLNFIEDLGGLKMTMWYGGQNKTHDNVAHYDRLDSYRVGALRGKNEAFWNSGGSIVMDCPGDSVELFYSTNELPVRLELSRVANHYGGSRVYFICPDCGRRARFLYRPKSGGLFRCRCCWSLNYPTQQQRPNETAAYLRGVKLLRDRFKLPYALLPKPGNFYDFLPPRPKGMHRHTYRKLCQELELLQGEYYRCYYIRTHRVGKRVLWTDEAEDAFEW